jgi:type VI secretion system secreted protein Hcp
MATTDFFLKIDGVPGEAEDKTHKDTIELLSWSWGASNSGTMGHGGGGGAGKVNMQDFHFVMTFNKASPLLMLRCASGEHIKEATLFCRKPTGQGGQSEYLTVKFSDVIISSYQTGASSGGHVVPTDQISFNFTKIETEYKLQKADGSLGAGVKHGWDVKKNQKV